MSSTHLIDAIVRQTTVLIANLATASGQRATLARVANQVFSDLVTELKRQGLGSKVIADMFGLALRTYHKKVARLSESRSFQGQSLWEAVLGFVQREGTVLRADLLTRFVNDDSAVVRGVLTDLVDNGLLFRTGSGDRTSFRAARPEELPPVPDRADVLTQLVLVALHQHGPLDLPSLAERVGVDESSLARLLEDLVADDRAQRSEQADEVRYSCERVMIGFQEPGGWEAAIYDHYQAMVGALSTKLRQTRTQASPGEFVGGSTYTFDLWRGHPFSSEVLALLTKLRGEAVSLRRRVDDYNGAHAAPRQDESFRVVTYVGQNTVGYADDNEEGTND